MAAGKGTRMRCSSVHKVCFPLGGKPVINRTIETLHSCGIHSHFIVIRHLAEQLMQTVSSAPGIHYFCYQQQTRGTGNAAKTAAEIMVTIPDIDDVLVMAGDKVIEKGILKKLIDRFYETDSDLTFIVGNASGFKNSGRVLYKKGEILGILEVPDISRNKILKKFQEQVSTKPLSAEDAEKIVFSYLPDEHKAGIALGPLWERVKRGKSITAEIMNEFISPDDYSLTVNGMEIDPGCISNARYANLSVYLFKREKFISSLKSLKDDNAQKEEYLTDVVGILAKGGAKVTVLPLNNTNQLMTFNTPEELTKIETVLAAKEVVYLRERPQSIRKPLDWLRHLETDSLSSLKYFHGIYGTAYPGTDKKRLMLINAMKEYMARFGNNPVVVTRAPGRINLMGRHIDHQGGDVNMMALDRDIYCIAGERADRLISANSIEPMRFPHRQFSIDELGIGANENWHAFVNSSRPKISGTVPRGDWGQYVKAVICRFQHFSGKKHLKGMNILTASDLPSGGGISSSSALFVSIAEACILLNDIKVSAERFVELCGEGEQYVGTRGGSGDHAAIKYSQKGSVTHIGFYPLKKIETVPFPSRYIISVCNSQRQAHKTRGVRNIFNQRVACYHIGMELLSKQFPRLMNAMKYMRDMVYGKPSLSEKDIFSMLSVLPVEISAEELLRMGISDGLRARIENLPDAAGLYRVREVFIYGLAECLRSRRCSELLLHNEIGEFGRWMNISHEGDRVMRWTVKETSTPFHINYSDEKMKNLARRARESSDMLICQPGSYRCSIPEIDRMVDVSLSVRGVAGAQISGAGLGGCIMVMVKESAYEDLEKKMLDNYYDPLNLEQEMFITYPAEGSGLVRF